MNKNRLNILLAAIIFALFAGFWVYLGVNDLRGDSDEAELFSATYGVMALFGGIAGLFIGRKWGGFKSYIGRAVLLISLGLLAQEFGQVSYSMYTYLLNQEIPYPSLGDVGYFGSVVFYIFAIYYVIKATSVKLSYKSFKSKLAISLIPVVLLAFSYFEFLKGYEFDFSHPLTVFLDFAYPLGQAFYIALAILSYLLSRKYLGGHMRPVILSVLLAFILQYIADFSFLYQTSRGTWETGGVNELMYLISYFAATLALLGFGSVLNKLAGSRAKAEVSDES